MTAFRRPCADFPSALERELLGRGTLFAGTDEVGRGPLAGPVVAAAVIWDYKCPPKGMNDSKLLSEVERRELFHYIIANALSVGVACVEPEDIDRINILQASLWAMALAVEELKTSPEAVLVDGNRKSPYCKTSQICCVKGDFEHLAIAAASIVAKTVRDDIMTYFESIYPGYGFASNFGYPTIEHREMLRKLGPCPIHRKTFNGVKQFFQTDLFDK